MVHWVHMSTVDAGMGMETDSVAVLSGVRLRWYYIVQDRSDVFSAV